MESTLVPSAYEPFRDHALAHQREHSEKNGHAQSHTHPLIEDSLPHTRSLNQSRGTKKKMFKSGGSHFLRYVLMFVYGLASILALVALIAVANVLCIFAVTRHVNQWDPWVQQLHPVWPGWLKKTPVYLLLSSAIICTVASLSLLLYVKQGNDHNNSKRWLGICVVITLVQAVLSLASGIYNHSFDTRILHWDFLSWTCSAHQSSDQLNFQHLCTELRVGIYTSLAFAGVDLLALVFTVFAWFGARKTRGKYSAVTKKH